MLYIHILLTTGVTMAQFTNYNNICPNYIPNNIIDKPVLHPEFIYKTVHPIYNDLNKIIGYEWNYGDTFTYIVDIAKKISVPKNSVVFTVSGEAPTTETVPPCDEYRKAYNTADIKSWTCIEKIDDEYVWEEDKELEYFENGQKEIILKPSITGKILDITVYNFRMEQVYNIQYPAAYKLNLEMTAELSRETFVKGIYYLSVQLKSPTETNTQQEYITLHVN